MTSELRLSRVLEERRARVGSYEELANEIARKNDGNKVLDRRKLKDLVDSEKDVSLRLSELRALDRYLGPIGEGLSAKPFFVQPSILEALGAGEQLAFLIGAAPRPEDLRIDMARWDIEAMAQILRDLNRHVGPLQFDIQNVLNPPSAGARRKTVAEVYKEEPWYRHLETHGTSIVSVGSPRACRATEVVLARMFGATPFEQPAASKVLPFTFAWPGGARMGVSAFSVDSRRLSGEDKKLAREIEQAKPHSLMGLWVQGEVYVSRQDDPQSRTYGVIVLQRRHNNQTWLALCGLTGPATLAAAWCVKKVMSALPERSGDKKGLILFAVVEAVLMKDQTPGDPRQVVSQELVGEPQIWDPSYSLVAG